MQENTLEAAPLPTEAPAERLTFHITSDAAANWLLQKLANIEAEKQRIQAQAAEMVRQLEADAEGLRFLYMSEVEQFCREKLAEKGGRRRSVTFLQGTAAFRKVPASLRISDEAAALAYATEQGFALRTVLDTTSYREAAQKAIEAGERLPGVDMTPERESFSLKFGR